MTSPATAEAILAASDERTVRRVLIMCERYAERARAGLDCRPDHVVAGTGFEEEEVRRFWRIVVVFGERIAELRGRRENGR